MEQSISGLYKGGEAGALEAGLEAYRGRQGEKEGIILREQQVLLVLLLLLLQVREEISHLTKELEELRASEVEMRKKEMRKIAELKVSVRLGGKQFMKCDYIGCGF